MKRQQSAAAKAETEPEIEHDVCSGVRQVPRCYDSVPDDDEGGTAASETVAEYARLSNGMAVPKVVFEGDLVLLPLDPTAAFILSLIDGVASLESIVDGSPFGEANTISILSQLVQMKLVTLA